MASRSNKLPASIMLVVMAAALVLPSPEFLDQEFWHPIFDIAHLPVFAGLGLWLVIRLDALGVRYAAIATLVTATAVTIAVELIQPLVGRSGNPLDALTGMVGTLITVSGRRVWIASRSPWLRVAHALLSVGLAVAVIWPALLQLAALGLQAHRFPVLGDFESSLEARLWRSYPDRTRAGADCPGGATHGRGSLRVETTPGVYSGVRYQANDRDWRGYDRLTLDVYLPEDGPLLAIRIDDDGDTTAYASRFNRSLALKPGWNHVNIALDEIAAGPEDRQLDLGSIRQVLMFSTPTEARAGLFCIDWIRLE